VDTDLVNRRRDEIISAAIKVFSEKGYHAARIEDIAAELGIGHGTFYRYFKNKRDIFEHATESVVASITEVVAEESPTAADSLEEYREQLYRIGEDPFRLFMENPYMPRILFYETFGLGEEMRLKVDEIFQIFGRYTEQYLLNGIRKGFLRKNIPTRETALGINSMIFEAARSLARSSNPEEEYPRWLEAVVGLMIDGLGA
jgi:AcrR family transcriptional regulator